MGNSDGSLKQDSSSRFQRSRVGSADGQRGEPQVSASGSVIDRWRRQARQGGLEASPSVREKTLERENRELKEKLAELYLENAQLKKLGDWLRRHKSVSTSVITAQSLTRLPKGSKS